MHPMSTRISLSGCSGCLGAAVAQFLLGQEVHLDGKLAERFRVVGLLLSTSKTCDIDILPCSMASGRWARGSTAAA